MLELALGYLAMVAVAWVILLTLILLNPEGKAPVLLLAIAATIMAILIVVPAGIIMNLM